MIGREGGDIPRYRGRRWAILWIILAAVATAATAARSATETVALVVDGATRTARIHVPEGLDASHPVPLVLAFHGSALNGSWMEESTGFSPLAEEMGFVVAYPDGTGPSGVLSWNAGSCCSSALERGVDDLRFVDALIHLLVERYPIDTSRVYATGFSNGGMMAYTLALARPERFAAIAVVSGAMFAAQQPSGIPMPTLILHGTDDAVLPYEGGWGTLRNLSGKTEPALPVAGAVAFWIENNGCTPTDPVTVSERNAQIQTYAGCDREADVVLITLLEGTHVWPTIEHNPSAFLVSDDAYELFARFSADAVGEIIPWDLFEVGIDATRTIWEFFEQHTR